MKILVLLIATFVAYDCHSLLWTEAKAFERLQRSYLNMCIKHVHITCASFNCCQKYHYLIISTNNTNVA